MLRMVPTRSLHATLSAPQSLLLLNIQHIVEHINTALYIRKHNQFLSSGFYQRALHLYLSRSTGYGPCPSSSLNKIKNHSSVTTSHCELRFPSVSPHSALYALRSVLGPNTSCARCTMDPGVEEVHQAPSIPARLTLLYPLSATLHTTYPRETDASIAG